VRFSNRSVVEQNSRDCRICILRMVAWIKCHICLKTCT
jgi:hypothetical protein